LGGAVHGASMVELYMQGDEAEGTCEVYENAKERVGDHEPIGQ